MINKLALCAGGLKTIAEAIEYIETGRSFRSVADPER